MEIREKVILTTFGLFMIEAIMHYNMGKEDCTKPETKKGFLPPTKSLIKLGLIVGVFSVVNGLLIKKIGG